MSDQLGGKPLRRHRWTWVGRANQSPRNAVVSLASRELSASPASRVTVARRHLRLDQVLQHGDGCVLLGFSSDGNFLIYAAWSETGVTVQWKQADWTSARSSHSKSQLVYSLRVGGSNQGPSELIQECPSFSGSFVRVWQSVDTSLVMAVVSDHHADPDSPQLFQMTVAPAPCFGGGVPASVASLRFEYTAQTPSQQPVPWQLIELSRSTDIPSNVYHLLLNRGSSVIVAVFHVKKTARSRDDQPQSAGCHRWIDKKSPRGLGISHFAQNDWYYSPEFPLEFERSVMTRKLDNVGAHSTEVECLSQQLFDVEKYLYAFIAKFAGLRGYFLVDYDLRLVRVVSADNTLFISCVMQLASQSPSHLADARPQVQRLALCFGINLFTGAEHVVRALKLPSMPALRHLSARVARTFLVDVNARFPPERVASAWDNGAAVREQSLRALHNPMYPVSIYLD